MYKIKLFAVCGCFAFLSSHAQDNIKSILQQVEQNNSELKALKSEVESQELTLKSGNNLPDPEFGLFYLPFGDHTGGNYTEYQISQTIEFPTVYGARGGLIREQSEQLSLRYQSRRQSILSEAQGLCLELIYLNKQLEVEKQRIVQAKTVLDQVQTLFDQEQVGILALNKAKLDWMQDQFKVEKVEAMRLNVRGSLQSLNGGEEVELSETAYGYSLEMPELQTLWGDKLSADPELKQLQQLESIAIQQLRLSKSNSLPDLTAGFNSQGVAGQRFSGIYAGLSIPVWSNRNKVKSAQSNIAFQQAYSTSRLQVASTSFETEYRNYLHKLSRFQEYKRTLADLNTEVLLLEAYQLEEISYLEYYMELQFYRKAFDTMLEVEHELHQSLNELLKHQL